MLGAALCLDEARSWWVMESVRSVPGNRLIRCYTIPAVNNATKLGANAYCTDDGRTHFVVRMAQLCVASENLTMTATPNN